MLIKLLTRLFGTKNDRVVKRLALVVEQINALEATYKALDDEALKALTPAFKERYAQGETLDALLPEAFAAVREASCRVLEMRHPI